jgi:hypothetical protein
MNRYIIKYSLICFVIIAILKPANSLAAESETESDYTTEDCIECHRMGSEESSLLISIEEFQASIHGQEETACLDCHTQVLDETHQETEGSGAVDCSGCHEQENRHGLKAKADQRPQCHDCHTRHNIIAKDDPRSTVHMDMLPKTCGNCHAVEAGKTNYFSWFPSFQIASHNKGDFGTAYDKDNCLGCHQGMGAHGETEPLNDQDCYKCHQSQESDGAMWGYMHPKADAEVQTATFASAVIYQVFIAAFLLTLFGKFLVPLFKKNREKK